MKTETTPEIRISATIDNLADWFEARRGVRAEAEVRRVEVPDVRVEAGAFGLRMPRRLRDRLGMDPDLSSIARCVRLAIGGRDCVVEVEEVADHLPVIVGWFPLSMMDWVVDVKGHRLIGNPEHGGEERVDIL